MSPCRAGGWTWGGCTQSPAPWSACRREKGWGWVGAYAAGHLILWFSTRVVLRFLMPLAPLMALLAARGFGALYGRFDQAQLSQTFTQGLVNYAVQNIDFIEHK